MGVFPENLFSRHSVFIEDVHPGRRFLPVFPEFSP
jgi:hypothetical protein